MNRRKDKLLREGIMFSKKEISFVRIWIAIELIFIFTETLFWILSIFLYNNMYLTLFLPMGTFLYIIIFLHNSNKWWLNIKSSFSVKKLTSDYRYIYILTKNDYEFRLIVQMIEIIPHTGLLSYFIIGAIGAIFSFPFILSIPWSIILSMPLQIVLCFWIALRLFLLRRLLEALPFITRQEENRYEI